jgi:hypothetical protein
LSASSTAPGRYELLVATEGRGVLSGKIIPASSGSENGQSWDLIALTGGILFFMTGIIVYRFRGYKTHDKARRVIELVKKTADDPQVFVSYSRKDWQDYVVPLVDRLHQAGLAVWIDQNMIEGGNNWLRSINEALEKCPFLILCVTPDALASDYVQMEYQYFIVKKKQGLLPLFCRPTDLPPDLVAIQYYQYDDLDKLIERLKQELQPNLTESTQE